MRTKLYFVALLLSVSPRLSAQKLPEVELFGGYSYLRTHTSRVGGAYNLSGWEASLTGEVSHWFGVEADFSNHYGAAPSPFLDQPPRFSYLFGPRFAVRMLPGVTPFAHALFGAVRGTVVTQVFGPGGGVGLATRPETAFGMAYGGGLDLNVARNLWLRPVQADYVRSDFTDDRRNDLRLSTGVVLRFGKR